MFLVYLILHFYYVQSYQSGVYHKDGICFGFLLDKCAYPGNVFRGKTFISHGGGGSKLIDSSTYALKRSQTEEDFGIRSLLNSMSKSSPIVVILVRNQSVHRQKKTIKNYFFLQGNECPLLTEDFAKQLPGRYTVLGYYYIKLYWKLLDEKYQARYYFLFEVGLTPIVS
jgi:hypothetical protein